MSEAKVSALIVAGLTCVGLTLMLSTALRDVVAALEISVPVSAVVGAVLFLTASDGLKTNGDAKSPKDN